MLCLFFETFCILHLQVSVLFGVLGYVYPVLGRIFSNDHAVLELSRDLAFLVGISYIFLAIYYSSMATLEGQARYIYLRRFGLLVS